MPLGTVKLIIYHKFQVGKELMLTQTRQRFIYVVGDFLSTALAWFLFNIFRFIDIVEANSGWGSLKSFLLSPTILLGQVLFPVGMLMLYWLSGYYNRPFLKSRIEELVTTLTTALAGAIIIYFIAIVNDPIPDRLSNYVLLLMLAGILFAVVYTVRVILTTRTTRKIRRGELRFNALIVGNRSRARVLLTRLRMPVNVASHAFNVVGFVDTDASHAKNADLPVIGLEDVESFCVANDVRAIVLATRNRESRETLTLINRFLPLRIPVYLPLSTQDFVTAKPQLQRVAAEPLIDVTTPNIPDHTVNFKRAFDVVGASVALVLCMPLMLVLYAIIKCTSKGPVIFRQERIGLNGTPFRIYKFRSMVIDAEPSGPALAVPNDSRITPIGRFMRKYRLDELPQFLNVIGGSMSLVGPRPERAFYVEQILQRQPYYTLVHRVRPGITSLGMVKYGYACNVDEMIERMQYDLIYLENVSITTDLKILAYTVTTVISGKGL